MAMRHLVRGKSGYERGFFVGSVSCAREAAVYLVREGGPWCNTFEVLTIGSSPNADMEIMRARIKVLLLSRRSYCGRRKISIAVATGSQNIPKCACSLAQDISVGFALRGVSVLSQANPEQKLAKLVAASRGAFSLVVIAAEFFESFHPPSLDKFVADSVSLIGANGALVVCARKRGGPFQTVRDMYPESYFRYQASAEDIMASSRGATDVSVLLTQDLCENVDVTETLAMSDRGVAELARRLGLRWESTPESIRDEVLRSAVQIFEPQVIAAPGGRRTFASMRCACVLTNAASSQIAPGCPGFASSGVVHVQDLPRTAAWWPHGKGPSKAFVNYGLDNWVDTRRERVPLESSSRTPLLNLTPSSTGLQTCGERTSCRKDAAQ